MAGGAYLSAKNGAMEFVSKHMRRSAGEVSAMEGGPSRPEEVTHTSSLQISLCSVDVLYCTVLVSFKRRSGGYLPHEFSTSSIKPSVSSSLVILYGYPITFVLGCVLLTSSASWA